MSNLSDMEDDHNFQDSKEFISLSRFTVYHSAEDLDLDQSRETLPQADSIAVDEERNLMEHKTDMMALEAMPRDDKVGETWFNDGERTVDFVLVWSEKTCSHKEAPGKREIFERHLEQEGLQLERETSHVLNFVKIHAPREVLCRYTEILKLRMPMKEIPGQESLEEPSFDIMQEVKSLLDRFLNFVNVDPKIFKPTPHKLTAEFSRDRNYLFDTEAENFFTCSIRILVVDFILERNKFTEDKENLFAFGIQRLIADHTYEAAYPLHDGDYHAHGSLRHRLYSEWASVRKWIMHQPIDHVKDYFGVKYGLYFAWLGFYTHMLIPAAVVGLGCFVFGLSTMYSNNLSKDICNRGLNITMCPLCDFNCDYWNLAETCTYARITYLFDNPSTVFFAVFMSFWGTLFLELWKRYSAGISHRWGLTGFDHQAEHPRPEYLARLANAKRQKVNVVTNKTEPYVPFWKVRVPFTVLSFSVVLLLISVAVGAVFGVVLYRMAILASKKFFDNSADTTSYIIVFIPATAATINLVCILLLNWFYDWLAVKLTDLELLRTQTQYDDSLTLKIYLFHFVNYYTSIFYIAFLKGKFVGYPAKYNRIFSLRQEECSPGGCLMELCIQLAIIMVGKQAMNSILEIVMPMLNKWFTTLRVKAGMRKAAEDVELSNNQWNHDYRLLDWGPRGLFPEYLEMVLQYGFVTIFVAAFPLAPLFAIINNVFEMRLDAKKFLTFYRRPVPRRVKDIGVWYRILDILGRISVVTNAFIIAFSSNFIPQLVYSLVVNPERTDEGYLEFSLAHFNTSDFAGPDNSTMNVEICRYSEYRNPHDHENKYKRPPIYWHILAARLAFVVVYQNVVGFVTMAIQWLIPDVPSELRDQMRREAYLTNETIIAQETLRAREAGTLNSANFIAGEAAAAAAANGSGDGGANLRKRLAADAHNAFVNSV